MRIRKLMYDTFYSNNESFSNVTSISALTSDLYFWYYKEEDFYKVSGNTQSSASGSILVNSETTSISVSPATLKLNSGNTITLTDELTILNQNLHDVSSECSFVSLSPTVATTGGTNGIYLTGILTGTTVIKVIHNDGPTGSTTVTGLWGGTSLTISPTLFTGATSATTIQAVVTTSPTNKTVTSTATYSIADTSIATVTSGGLVSFTALTGSTTLTVTYGSLTATKTVSRS